MGREFDPPSKDTGFDSQWQHNPILHFPLIPTLVIPTYTQLFTEVNATQRMHSLRDDSTCFTHMFSSNIITMQRHTKHSATALCTRWRATISHYDAYASGGGAHVALHKHTSVVSSNDESTVVQRWSIQQEIERHWVRYQAAAQYNFRAIIDSHKSDTSVSSGAYHDICVDDADR